MEYFFYFVIFSKFLELIVRFIILVSFADKEFEECYIFKGRLFKEEVK